MKELYFFVPLMLLEIAALTIAFNWDTCRSDWRPDTECVHWLPFATSGEGKP